MRLACERGDALASHNAPASDKVSHAALSLATNSDLLAALYTRTSPSCIAYPIACVLMILCVDSACASALGWPPIARRKPTMDRLIECITATNFGLSIGFPYHINRNKAAIEPSRELDPSYVPHRYTSCASAPLQASARLDINTGGTC